MGEAKSSNWQIKAGAIMSYVVLAINILAGFIYTPWMLSVIGESNYGLYTLATSLISLFMMDFGISAATARFVARYRAQGETEKINKFLGIVYKLYIIIDLIIALIFLVVYLNVDNIYANLTDSEIKIFKNVLLIVIFYNLLAFPMSPLSGILNAYEKFFPLKLVSCCNKIFTVVATVIALLLGGGLYSLILIHVIFNLTAILLRLIFVKKFTPIKTDFKAWDKEQFKGIFTFSIWATLVSITSRLIFNITPSILAMFVSSAGVAMFGLASTLEGYVFMFSDAVNGLFLSKATKASLSKNRERDTLNLMTRVGRIDLSIVAIIIIGFLVAGKDFVTLWLGSGYDAVYYCAILIITPNLIYFPQQIGRTLLVVDGKQKYQ
ncbi:MAG: oligosaccharide flippase family protein, partial [Clostridia bacterium]|nr:oligosaccharide flippase family protein [Clostridia bacterium]